MANLIANGIPLLNSLRLMTSATGNVHLRSLTEKIVGNGRRRRIAFPRPPANRRVSPLFIDMIAVGEQTGDLAQALERIGRRYDKELNIKYPASDCA